MAELHSREIEMMKRESLESEHLREVEDREKLAAREKDLLSRQLQEVVKVAAEMEEYYVAEFKKKNDQLLAKEQELASLQKSLENNRTKQEEVLRQTNFKWEQRLTALKDQYEDDISELQRKIAFLVSKIDSQSDCQSKPSLGALSTISDLIQSKMVQSNSSAESLPMDSTFFQYDRITRRNTSGSKTPNKYSKRK